MKIVVFYPTQIRNFNPFDTAERRVFEYLAKNYDIDITLFVDRNNNYSYSGKFLKIRTLKSFPSLFHFPLKAVRKIFNLPIPLPIYLELLIKKELRNYDCVLTENPWHPLTLYPYFQARKYILVDSATLDQRANKIVSRVVKKASGILCITPLVMEKYKRLGLSVPDANRIKVIGGHPIDVNLFKPPENYPDEKVINIVSTGRLVYEKGFHVIIEAFGGLIKKYRNVHLHIIGEGNYREELMNKVRKLRLSSLVKFYGALKSKEIAEIYKSMHIFVNHSLETPYWQEYFGMANLEAMSSELPVITTDCGAIAWAVKDNAVIVKQEDVKELIEALENLIENKSLRIKSGRRGRNFVQNNYTVEKVAKQYYSLIKEFAK